jgi:hypothetical protein
MSTTADHLYDALALLRRATHLENLKDAAEDRADALGALEALVEELRAGGPYPEVDFAMLDGERGFTVRRRP